MKNLNAAESAQDPAAAAEGPKKRESRVMRVSTDMIVHRKKRDSHLPPTSLDLEMEEADVERLLEVEAPLTYVKDQLAEHEARMGRIQDIMSGTFDELLNRPKFAPPPEPKEDKAADMAVRLGLKMEIKKLMGVNLSSNEQ